MLNLRNETKITLNRIHAAYAKRFAEKNGTTVKAAVEGLIEEHLLEDLLALTPSSLGWADFQNAANSLLPPDWNIEPAFNAAGSAVSPVKLFHMICIGEIRPLYVPSSALKAFSAELQAVAENGGAANLDSAFKLGSAGIQVRRKGNGLIFLDYDSFGRPDEGPRATYPTRHVDKLQRAFSFAIKAQEVKRKDYYGE